MALCICSSAWLKDDWTWPSAGQGHLAAGKWEQGKVHVQGAAGREGLTPARCLSSVRSSAQCPCPVPGMLREGCAVLVPCPPLAPQCPSRRVLCERAATTPPFSLAPGLHVGQPGAIPLPLSLPTALPASLSSLGFLILCPFFRTLCQTTPDTNHVLLTRSVSWLFYLCFLPPRSHCYQNLHEIWGFAFVHWHIHCRFWVRRSPDTQYLLGKWTKKRAFETSLQLLYRILFCFTDNLWGETVFPHFMG